MGASMRRPICHMALGAALVITVSAGVTGHVAGLTCATPVDGAELAITSGWPDAAPFEFVVIGTIRDIQAERGDAATWGEVLSLDVDAVLRGDLPLSALEIFNPPLGSAGWLGFRPGAQYLIAANPSSEGTGGRVSTFLCAPNEEISSPERFAELVSFAAEPRLPDTAMPSTSSAAGWGYALVLLDITLGAIGRRRMQADGCSH